MSAFQPPALWFQVEGLLCVVGFGAMVVGVVMHERLRRRFEQKTGRDMYGLREAADRYLARPWLWFVEAPGVIARGMAVGTTALADPELEAMRRMFRKWVTFGGLCCVAGVFWFLAPIAWFLVTTW